MSQEGNIHSTRVQYTLKALEPVAYESSSEGQHYNIYIGLILKWREMREKIKHYMSP